MMTNNININIKDGYYLDKLELYNWGTFHNRIWTIAPGMDASLVTGDFGSGKSTIVDAITALLVPPNKIVFNKSAGADKQERNFSSYVLGHYKSESDENTRKGSKKGLRENRKSYTALLAVFKNQKNKKIVTLAQIMTPRPKGDNRAPDKIFIISETELSIKDHIGMQYPERGKKKYKKWLSDQYNAQIFDTFNSYADCFRRLLRLKSNQALDLFHKAISLKQIENLTTFVRDHMLEEHDTNEKIKELCVSYQQLNELHDIVVKERKQVEHLTMISDFYKEYSICEEKEAIAREAAKASEKYFAKLKVEKYGKMLDRLKKTVTLANEQIQKIGKDTGENEVSLEKVKEQIIREGGAKADELKQKIKSLESQLEEKENKANRYKELADKLDLQVPQNESSFYDNSKKIEQIVTHAEENKKHLKEKYNSNIISFQKYNETISNIEEEIKSLNRRESNIPHYVSRIRDEMAESLDLKKDELPFVGELLKVDEKEKKWEGAIERVLRGFGLSIVVPAELYSKVSNYVDKTHLKGKVVYLRVNETEQATKYRSPQEENSLVHKLNIKDGSNFQDWLWNQLCQKYDYSCSETIEDFRRKNKAITINGQIKSSGSRHEKDDRSSISDKSKYILGWENKEKIQELQKILRKEQLSAQEIAVAISTNDKEESQLTQKIISASNLKEIASFSEIDSKTISQQIDYLQSDLEELKKIESSSEVMKKLREKENQLKMLKRTFEVKSDEAKDERSRAQQSIDVFSERWKDENSKIKDITDREEAVLFPIVEAVHSNIEKKKLEEDEKLVTAQLNNKVEKIVDSKRSKQTEMEKKMQAFKHEWEQDSYDLEATISGVDEFLIKLEKLVNDELPEHEDKFREKLRTDTINNVAIFRTQLESHKGAIEERIQAINDSLKSVSFSPETYIQLLYQNTTDNDIREFREELRSVLSDTLSDDLYAEEKYLQVKELIEKFKGRESLSEQDKKWAQKVTDVRNWFTFAASEKFQDNHQEKEYYPDSGGKSGGEKERLAYTVLASALLYQYGKDFKFVIIDEAFGKGSEESARFGMELFRELGLQLLVITPLQKINVIEKYIKKVHFVRKIKNMESYVDDWTLEEYQKKKEEFLQNDNSERFKKESPELV